ncbi:MAG: autoinducer binding domain-containing protein [Stellaceae bacterium]
MITDYPPAWRDRVRAERYDLISQTTLLARTRALPFVWRASDLVPNASRAQRKLLAEAAQFGSCGATVPLREAGGRHAKFTVTADSATDFLSAIQDNLHMLHLVALHFDAIRQTLPKSSSSYDEPHLSFREHECLRWAARGKSSFEIAGILLIGRRTVIFHLENAKSKLGVTTLRQAIVEAMRLGIDIID